MTVYKELLKIGRGRVNEISKLLGKDRTTIQRSLNRLVKAGLCMKEKKILDNGGYFYLYSARKPEELKSSVERCLDEWYNMMKRKIKHIDELLIK